MLLSMLLKFVKKLVSQLKDNPDMEIAEIRSMMKEQSMKYIIKETGKKPVFIGVVVEI